jgi:hypothetical protein
MQITPSFVNPPRPGKKMGSAKLPDNSILYFYPDKVSLTPGQAVTVEYADKMFGDKPAKVIERVVQPNGSNGHAAPAPSGGGYQRAGTDKETAERIYVCGIINAAVSAGKLDLSTDALISATEAARDAWAATFGAPRPEAGQHPNGASDTPF